MGGINSFLWCQVFVAGMTYPELSETLTEAIAGRLQDAESDVRCAAVHAFAKVSPPQPSPYG